MVLLGIQSPKRAIPFPVEQAHPIPVKHIHHVGIVSRCRWQRRQWADLRPSKELHFSLLMNSPNNAKYGCELRRDTNFFVFGVSAAPEKF